MTQILVTLDDNSIAPKIMKAIEMLKGVVNISLYKESKEGTTTAPSQQVYSQRIQRLRGIAKGITQQQIEDMAIAKLVVDFNKKQDHIEEQYSKTVAKIQIKKQQAQNKALLDKQKVQNNLQQKIDEITFDMLRRGLANSSIKD